ncbi:MAG: rhodanese-like domain-containing protein [Mariprofundaceae bacterium]|nr:rhodanese-like domain-containing protein [Mariprofundaceae bacterium]
MDWVQQNIVNIIVGTLIFWLLWKRFIAPKLSGVKSISATDYHQFRNEAHTLLDVRSDSEWQSGHPSTAIHIELGQINQRMDELSKDKALVVICASGNRSAMAATKLANAGFEPVYNFSGGMGSWEGAGLPVKQGR